MLLKMSCSKHSAQSILLKVSRSESIILRSKCAYAAAPFHYVLCDLYCYNSFLPGSGPAPPAPICIGFPLSVTGAPCFSRTKIATTAAPTICTTVIHAIPHTCILTLPIGALGNESIHSMYHGTQPTGIQNIGCFEYQNCRMKRRPFVERKRRNWTERSKVDLKDFAPFAGNVERRLA